MDNTIETKSQVNQQNMEQNNQTPSNLNENPFTKKSNKSTYGLIIVFILGITLLVALSKYNFKKTPQPINQAPIIQPLTQEQIKQKMISKSNTVPQINLSNVTSQSTITQQNLPQELSNLILDQAQNSQVQKLTLKGGKIAYIITYSKSDALSNVHIALSNKLGGIKAGQITNSLRSDIFSVIEANLKTFQVRIESSPDNTNSSSVNVKIQAQP